MKIQIDSEYIQLQSLLKFAEIASTGGFAKVLIQEGAVSLNGITETRRGKKIYPGDLVKVNSDEYEIQEEILVEHSGR